MLGPIFCRAKILFRASVASTSPYHLVPLHVPITKHNTLSRFLHLLIYLSIFAVVSEQTAIAFQRRSATVRRAVGLTQQKKTTSGKKLSPGRRKPAVSRRSTKRRGKATVSRITALSIMTERSLAPGVRYLQYRTLGGRPSVVHVLSIDRTMPGTAIRIAKAQNRFDGLERIADLASRYSSESGSNVLAMINANFWRAGRSTVIGPCIVDGEIVEMLPYKGWSTAMFDVEDRLTIDTFRVSGKLSFPTGSVMLSSVNRRLDSGAVLFNRFAGESVPIVHKADIDRQITEIMRDTLYLQGDSTEQELSRELLRRELSKAQQESNQEFNFLKIRFRYLRSPSLNIDVPLEIIGIDSGSVDVPLRGCVLSVPKTLLPKLPRIGDRCTMRFSTNVSSNVKFMNAVSGTPRLVRSGIANHEAEQEGATSRRFIQQQLARTAIGSDRSGSRNIFVAIEPTRNGEGTAGTSLQQLAQIMRLLGCHNSMNLDGGGSSGMIVEQDHVFFEGEDPPTRRIAVGISVVRRSHILRSVIGGTAEP